MSFLSFKEFLLLFSDLIRLFVLSFERNYDSPRLFRESDINILLPGDVVVPKCPLGLAKKHEVSIIITLACCGRSST